MLRIKSTAAERAYAVVASVGHELLDMDAEYPVGMMSWEDAQMRREVSGYRSERRTSDEQR